MQVKNRKVITRLALRSMKARRLRNSIAVLAIVLTAVLFTTCFSIGGNMIKSFDESTMRQVGTSAHAGLKYLSAAQYEHMVQSPLIVDSAYSNLVAIAENDALRKKQTEIRYGQDKAARWMFSYPTAGRMPETENEIALSTLTLDMLGLPHELGAQVPLEYTLYGQKHEETFTLSGYWEGDDVMQAAQAWVSEAYKDSVVNPPLEADEILSIDDVAGRYNVDIFFGSSVGIDGKMEELLTERGMIEDEIEYGINWAYTTSYFDAGAALIAAAVVLLILISGYLIIYSVFMISVSGDIRFYGLLKTIGTTGRQLRRIVYLQAGILSLIGIPLGLAAGYLLGYVLTPALMDMVSSGTMVSHSVSPLIFIFAALLSFITVWLSCRKPARAAMKIAPVEAVRYTEGTGLRRVRKKTKRVSPYRMALANTGRSRKRFFVIVLSLSLSLVLLNGVYSLVRGFDMDAYLENTVLSDFTVSHYSLFIGAIQYDVYDGIDPAFEEALAAQEGVKQSDAVYFTDAYNHALSAQGLANVRRAYEAEAAQAQPGMHTLQGLEDALREGTYPTHIYATGREGFGFIGSDAKADIFDKLESGNYVLIGAQNETSVHSKSVYEVGDIIPLAGSDGEIREFEVIGEIDYPYPLTCRHSHLVDQTVVMASAQYLALYGERGALMHVFNVEEGSETEIERWLDTYIESENPELAYRSRGFYRQEFETLQNTFLLLGGTLAFILALIGLLNFLNTIVTSILARRREFAMLQSVGMTGRQLRTMLYSEGLIYALATLLFSLCVGSATVFGLLRALAGQIWFFEFTFSVLPLLAAAPLLILLCMLIPKVGYAKLQGQTIVERLRVE